MLKGFAIIKKKELRDLIPLMSCIKHVPISYYLSRLNHSKLMLQYYNKLEVKHCIISAKRD